MKNNRNAKGTIAGALREFSGFTIRMFLANAIIMIVFFVIIFINVYNFYNVQFVTEKYQMEIRKDVQTINKRLLFAVASNDPEVTADQKADLEKMQRIGAESYDAEQVEKRRILDRLLAEYNDGRKKDYRTGLLYERPAALPHGS